MLKRTSLYAAHQKLGARLVEFGGWEMPVQYTSIVDEHLAVRQAAGLFDISHMGEVEVTGPTAAEFLNRTLTNDIRKLEVGLGQYTLMANEVGGVVDDLYAYRLEEQRFLLVINASRIEPDLAWLRAAFAVHAGSAADRLEDRSAELGAVAVQGPRVAGFIDTLVRGSAVLGAPVTRPTELRKNQTAHFVWGGGEEAVQIARTGYTGEDGFEVIAAAGAIERVWQDLLTAGGAVGLKPAGLGARDTLRTEMCYPLYGHELDEHTTPLEAGLAVFVALDKAEFAGRAALLAQKAQGVSRRCVAFKMTEKSAPPRPHYPIWSSGAGASRLGEVVSGTQSPSLSVGIGLGYVPPAFAKPGRALEIEVRGRRSPAVVVPKPIYRPPKPQNP